MIELTRFAQLPERTIGRLRYHDHEYWTIEKPWKDNQPYVSSIPDGYYPLHRVDSPRFGENMWEIGPVPGRTHILIHVANTEADVVGCIGLGQRLYPDLDGVGPSRPAVEEFYRLTKDLTEEEIIIRTGAIS